MRSSGRWITVALIAVLALTVAACSDDGEGSVTLPETDVSVPEVTAPEVTAPEVTAPEVTAPEVAAPESDASSESTGANTSAILALVIGGIVVAGLVSYFASRSGAQKGAEDQRNAELAEQYRAEEAARKAQAEAMPPPPVPTDGTSAEQTPPTVEPSDGGSTASDDDQ